MSARSKIESNRAQVVEPAALQRLSNALRGNCFEFGDEEDRRCIQRVILAEMGLERY